ncbi:MAG TPA: hypothetical protein VI643_01995 [Planctomycetota bacterium]|nr:hypothetical protein [Planctomycetota bacterium]
MILIPTLIAWAAAQDTIQPLKDERSGDKIQLNQRVEVTTNSSHTIRGIVVSPYGAPKEYDPALARALVLDLTLEHERLNGTVAIDRSTIKAIRLLRALSKKEIDDKLRRKAIAERDLKKEDLARMAAQDENYKLWLKKRNEELGAKPPGEEEGPKVNTAEEEAALNMYGEFPEPEGWGEAKFAQLKDFLIPTFVDDPPYLDTRRPVPAPGGVGPGYAAADPREAKFVKNFELWKTGREIAKRKKIEAERIREEVPEKTVAGPKDVYASYRNAIQAGNVTAFKTLVAASVASALEAEAAPEATLAEKKASMTDGAVVLKSDEQGGTATLTVKGTFKGEDRWGTITLVKEGGAWKVLGETWSAEER